MIYLLVNKIYLNMFKLLKILIYDGLINIIGLPDSILLSFIVLERIISFPLAKNILFVSRYSGYSLYNISSISANISSPEQGIP